MRRVVVFVCLLFACSQEKPAETSGDPCVDGGAYLRVGVTDEACRVFTEEERRENVVVDPYKAPVWSSPSSGSTLARGTPPSFAWSKGTLASSTSRLRRFLSLEGVAHAHGDTTGDAFVLTFRDPSGKELLRVMTTELSYVPAASVWTRLAEAPSLRVDLAQMRVVRNVLAAGTKVTAAPTVSFAVAR